MLSLSIYTHPVYCCYVVRAIMIAYIIISPLRLLIPCQLLIYPVLSYASCVLLWDFVLLWLPVSYRVLPVWFAWRF